jgi:hypothetical protein
VASTVDRCCFCREPIQPVEGVWVGIVDQKPGCKHAPRKRHAKQVVLNPSKRKR